MQKKPEIQFFEIKNCKSKEFRRAMKIYKEAFPKQERHPVKSIIDRIDKGLYKFFIGRLGKKIVFTCWLFLVPDSEFLLFDYIAVDKKHRGKGIGSAFLQYLKQYLSENPQFKYVLFEVEDPEKGENKKERINRFKFYKKNGVKQIGHIKYILPPLSGTKGTTEMILMVTSLNEVKSMEDTVLLDVIYKIYKILYSKEKTDPYLLPFKQTLEKQNNLN